MDTRSCKFGAERLRSAIEAILARDPALRLECVRVFLSVCENEGLSIKDLVYACGLGESMVSRAVDTLCNPEQSGLLETARHPTDGRRRLVFLSENGKALLERISDILAEREITEAQATAAQ